jgi:hypothetical protein
MNKDIYATGTVGPTSHSNSMKGEDSMNELTDRLRPQRHLENLIGAAAIVATMNEIAQAKREQRTVPSKRKSALPAKKKHRKMVQVSRNRNR